MGQGCGERDGLKGKWNEKGGGNEGRFWEWSPHCREGKLDGRCVSCRMGARR